MTATIPNRTYDYAAFLATGDRIETRGEVAEIFTVRQVGDYLWVRYFGPVHTDVFHVDDRVRIY